MERALRLACSVSSKFLSGNSCRAFEFHKHGNYATKRCMSTLMNTTSSRTFCSSSVVLKSHVYSKLCSCFMCRQRSVASYSTGVDKEISKFLEKEIKFEKSRSPDKLPNISGFDIKTEGGDVTLTKVSGSEKIVVKLSVNGAVDSDSPLEAHGKQDESPKMVCRPPFDVEIIKGNTVLALQCAFPSSEAIYEEGSNYTQGGKGNEQLEDQFEIQEVAIHDGEWKDATYSVSAATMDAELFDLLMDLLDERGINDEFITQLVDYCTAYESKQYVNFLQGFQTFVEK